MLDRSGASPAAAPSAPPPSVPPRGDLARARAELVLARALVACADLRLVQTRLDQARAAGGAVEKYDAALMEAARHAAQGTLAAYVAFKALVEAA